MANSYITDFIHSLSTHEIKIAREYLKSSSFSNHSEKKEEKLFKLLINKKKDIQDKDLSKELNCNLTALHVLKSKH